MIKAEAENSSSKNQQIRYCAKGEAPDTLTKIYDDHINIAIWQRTLSKSLKEAVDAVLQLNPKLKVAMESSAKKLLPNINQLLGEASDTELSNDIAELGDMFCCLFGLTNIGLRLTVLDRAMCPKFHVDRVPCRLVTAYKGLGTEWLPHHLVNRQKLGPGSNNMPDDVSGLYQSKSDIEHLNAGEVALLKGELWKNNLNAGLVHRSPEVSPSEQRLIMTFDFSN